MKNELRDELLINVNGGNGDSKIIADQKLQEMLNGKTVQIRTGDLMTIVITAKEIASAIKQQFEVTIDKRKIQAPEIRQLGNFEFLVNIAAGVSAKMIASVV